MKQSNGKTSWMVDAAAMSRPVAVGILLGLSCGAMAAQAVKNVPLADTAKQKPVAQPAIGLPGKTGDYRVSAKNKPLAQILKAVSEKTGVAIHFSGLPSDPISRKCAGKTVRQVVECLLGPGANIAANTPELKTHNKLAASEKEQLWILSAPSANRQGQTADGSEAGAPDKRRNGSAQSLAERDKDQFEETLKQARPEAQDRIQRATALYNLGLTGDKNDPDVKSALLAAMSDENPSIREQAAASLKQLGLEVPEENTAHLADASVNPDSDAGKKELIGKINLLKQAGKAGSGNALEILRDMLPPDSQAEE